MTDERDELLPELRRQIADLQAENDALREVVRSAGRMSRELALLWAAYPPKDGYEPLRIRASRLAADCDRLAPRVSGPYGSSGSSIENARGSSDI